MFKLLFFFEIFVSSSLAHIKYWFPFKCSDINDWVCLFCPWIIYIQVTLKITDCLCWLHVLYYQFSFDFWALFLSLWLTLLVFVFDRVGWSTSSSRGAPPMTRGWQKPATSTASSWFTQRHACSTTEGCSTSNRYEDK